MRLLTNSEWDSIYILEDLVGVIEIQNQPKSSRWMTILFHEQFIEQTIT